jgi:hypothetical protein
MTSQPLKAGVRGEGRGETPSFDRQGVVSAADKSVEAWAEYCSSSTGSLRNIQDVSKWASQI